MSKPIIRVLLVDGKYDTYKHLLIKDVNEQFELFVSDNYDQSVFNYQQHLDCVLIDTNSAKPENIELIKSLREQNSTIPIIFLVENERAEKNIAKLGIGTFEFLIKKRTSATKLHATIADAVTRSNAAKETKSLLLENTDPFDYIHDRLGIDDLFEALENNQFYLSYQPIFDLRNYNLFGLEALIRWRHPTLGAVSPSDFIPIAEKSGLIIPIGKWVFVAACLQLQNWQLQNIQSNKLFINMSMLQLLEENFLDIFIGILELAKVETSRLGIDLTDISLINDIKHSRYILGRLRELGIHLAIDDFGTGYTSISYLKNLPVNALKIDRSLLKNIPDDPKDCAIVKSLISTSSKVGATIYAKGIETQQQLKFLIDNNCDMGQGFLLSKPLTPQETLKFIKEYKPCS